MTKDSFSQVSTNQRLKNKKEEGPIISPNITELSPFLPSHSTTTLAQLISLNRQHRLSNRIQHISISGESQQPVHFGWTGHRKVSVGAAAVDQLKVKPQTHLSAGGGSGIINTSVRLPAVQVSGRGQSLTGHLFPSDFKWVHLKDSITTIRKLHRRQASGQ